MKTLQLLVFFLIVQSSFSQPVKERLAAAMKTLEADSQMRHAIIGLCVVDTKTGLPVYEHNAQIGLAAASTQKLFTSGAAFELLGKEYRYRTTLGYRGSISSGVLQGNIMIEGAGDPTLGSWRYKDNNESVVMGKWVQAVKKSGIKKITGGVYVSCKRSVMENDGLKKWTAQRTPGGWIWDDIGNYYGAGADVVNWRENQFDVIFSPGNFEGERVDSFIVSPSLYNVELSSEVVTGAKGSGDNTIIYLAPDANSGVIRGTVPAGAKQFKISGAMPSPVYYIISLLKEKLQQQDVTIVNTLDSSTAVKFSEPTVSIADIDSPVLDSINYWFLKRSINLYGEALIQTIAFEKAGNGTTEKGVELVKDFWNQHGIDKSAINIIDGSGLSPQNRVTADAEVKVLQYAKTRPWFASFYYALPEYNGMKMKSGSIGGARAFAGYHTAKDGKEYTYSIIVNNYDGSSGQIVRKLYKVLDELK